MKYGGFKIRKSPILKKKRKSKYIQGKILQFTVKSENDWQQNCFFSLPKKAASQPSIWQMSTQSLG